MSFALLFCTRAIAISMNHTAWAGPIKYNTPLLDECNANLSIIMWTASRDLPQAPCVAVFPSSSSLHGCVPFLKLLAWLCSLPQAPCVHGCVPFLKLLAWLCSLPQAPCVAVFPSSSSLHGCVPFLKLLVWWCSLPKYFMYLCVFLWDHTHENLCSSSQTGIDVSDESEHPQTQVVSEWCLHYN